MAAWYRRERRYRIWVRSFGTCQWCWRPVALEEMTIDHIVPKSKGGGWEITNLQAMHSKCNSEKGDSIPPPLREGFARSQAASPLATGGVFAEWRTKLGL